jgi:hypothetical protein
MNQVPSHMLRRLGLIPRTPHQGMLAGLFVRRVNSLHQGYPHLRIFIYFFMYWYLLLTFWSFTNYGLGSFPLAPQPSMFVYPEVPIAQA